MSERDDPKFTADGASAFPEGFDDTVVEILSLGDQEEAANARAESDRLAASAPSSPPGGDDETRRLEALLAAERERALRLRADFDNYRKRTERERGEIERYALADALRDLLPVVDNLERALEAATEGADLRKGVEMIVRQFHELLKRYGLTPIPALGERFDPAVHEAVFHEEGEGVTAPTVVMELQRGYRLNDRLLRPSLVKVSVPKETTNDDTAAAPAE